MLRKVSTNLNDSALIHDNNQIGISYRGQTMRNHQSGAIFHRSI